LFFFVFRGNRLLPLSTLPSSGIFTNLKELYLNEMEISWKEVSFSFYLFIYSFFFLKKKINLFKDFTT